MKRVYFFLSLLLGACIIYPQSGWQRLQINLNQSICDIQFLDANTGYIVSGRNFSPGSVWKTTDGGNSWFLIFATPGYMKALCFSDVNTGTIVGFKTNLRRTNNGGINWSTFDLNEEHSLNGVYFVNTRIGWIVGDSNTIYMTTDFGLSWAKKQSGQADVSWRDVYFFDANTGVIAGESASRSRIIRTTDAGIHWSETFEPQGGWLRLSFYGNTGYAAGNGLLTGLIKTTNRGESWSFAGEFNSLKDVCCVDASVVYVTGVDGVIYKSTDTGLNWIYQTSGVTSTLYGLYFLNQNTGWACGDYGTIIKTTNGGNPIGIRSISNQIPFQYFLSQNFPNPFNPATKIRFDIPLSSGGNRGSKVRLVIYDLLGKEIAEPVDEQLAPGAYEIDFDGTNFPSGIYLYRLQAGEFYETKKMILLK